MRTNEERKNLIYERTKELRMRKQEKKRKRIIFCAGGGGLAVSLCLLISLCRVVPETVAKLSGNILPSFHGTASLFGNSEEFAYVVVATLAFLLGACFTLLLYVLRKKIENTQERDVYVQPLNRSEEKEDEKNCGAGTDE